ncbi:MAG: MaoC/PaaZ C-terminal domain-containing protein [Terracidiphilus sp.]
MDSTAFARRTFQWDDQHCFAALSGDHNPMHMDAIFARRTQAGRPVVHGVHCLMWMLDRFFQEQSVSKFVSRIQCKFAKLVYLEEEVEVYFELKDGARWVLQAKVGETVVLLAAVTFGDSQSAPRAESERGNSVWETEPIAREFADAAKLTGSLEIKASPAIETLFPWASRVMSPIRMAALAGMSRWIGMVNPGLHSVFTGLDLFCFDNLSSSLQFKVANADERYRRLRQEVRGCGFFGTVDSLLRRPPVQQASMQRVRTVVSAGEFSSLVALVIGVSRGLGEVTAKLIAAGGGRVVGTYAVGQAEAEHVASEIRESGGTCEILPFRLAPSSSENLPLLPDGINCLFYFATPPVVAKSSPDFDRELFDSYIDFYATGFAKLCSMIAAGNGHGVCALYPSTIYVEADRPANLTEYAMAKAAGEVLCSEMPRKLPRLTAIFRRIPRVLTDLSASAFVSDYEDPLNVMLPIVREVCSVVSSPNGAVPNGDAE